MFKKVAPELPNVSKRLVKSVISAWLVYLDNNPRVPVSNIHTIAIIVVIIYS